MSAELLGCLEDLATRVTQVRANAAVAGPVTLAQPGLAEVTLPRVREELIHLTVLA